MRFTGFQAEIAALIGTDRTKTKTKSTPTAEIARDAVADVGAHSLTI